MRVAFLSPESLHSVFTGGLAVHVTELAAGLERRGHEVHVITRRGAGQAAYDRIHGVHHHRVAAAGDGDAILAAERLAAAMAERFAQVTRMVGKVDVVHGHDWMAAPALTAVMHRFGTPGILTMHSTEYGRDGNVFFDGFARRVRDIEAAGCHRAWRVIAVSRFLAEEIARIYAVAAAKISVVGNGVNARAFAGRIDPGQVKRRYGIGALEPMIFAPARLTVQKGIDLLIRAMPAVRARFATARAVIAGEGPEADALRRLSRDIGVADAIVAVGRTARPDYIDLTRACDVFCVPSRNEPFGIVVLEAWAAARPVVVSRLGGPRDFVTDGVTGILVDADSSSIADGLVRVLAMADRGQSLGVAGQKLVEEKFGWDEVARATESVYREVAR
jgi:glycosyltransferase involved in cell wall biosynthesis